MSRSSLSVEKRWLGSVLVSMIASTFIVGIVVTQVLQGFTPMDSLRYLVILVCAALILALSIIAFVDYFAVDFSVNVRRQVSISKKEMMARKNAGRRRP
jgi:cytochrome b subunit of formate dehydrogenase